MAEVGKYSKLSTFWRVVFLTCIIGGLSVSIYYVFSLSFAGVLLNVASRFLVIAFLLPLVFLVMPAKGKRAGKIAWYDVFAMGLAFAIPFYFFLNSWAIVWVGWMTPSPFNFSLAIVLCLLVLEGGRRAGGKVYPCICLFFGLYPLVAGELPGWLYGRGISLFPLIGSLTFGGETGLVGLPSKVLVEVLIGYLVFAAVLIGSGAGPFFLNVAFALMGRFRGGPAKVAVLGSALFGSISGSPIANVVGIGSVTIPAMKKIGFSGTYAAALEACTSTGGSLMPPVMGAVAFIMAEFLGVSYATVVAAAVVPSFLYYLSLLLQVDAYSAKNKLTGLPKSEIPSLWVAVKDGWHFMFALAFLVLGLFYMRWEEMTPYYTSIVLLVLAMVRKKSRLNLRGIMGVLDQLGTLLGFASAVILPIAFVMGGLTMTGTAAAFANNLVSLSGGNAFFALLFGAAACYVLGMVGMVAPAYIFLAISMAPILVKMGFDAIAVHLFIVYWAILAHITPPVATAAFVAAAFAGSDPLRTSFMSARLGIILYFIPFFFVFSPALVLRGALFDTIYQIGGCIVGLALIAAGLEGYLWNVGKVNVYTRALLLLSGALLALPEPRTSILGLALSIILVGVLLMNKRFKSHGKAYGQV